MTIATQVADYINALGSNADFDKGKRVVGESFDVTAALFRNR